MQFIVRNQPTYQPFPNYTIGMKLHTSSITTNVSGSSDGQFFTTVKTEASESFTTNTTKIFTFTTPFAWTYGNNLAIACAWGQTSNYSDSGTMDIGSGTSFYDRSDTAGKYELYFGAFGTSDYRPVVQFICS